MADNTSKDSINIIENSATGDDSIQYMVSTEQGVVHGRNQAKGFRLKQVGGRIDGVALQQISKDITLLFNQTIGKDSTSLENNTPPASSNTAEHEPSTEFQELYGQGLKLGPVSTTDNGKQVS